MAVERGSQPLSQRDHLATNQQLSSRRGGCQLPLPPARFELKIVDAGVDYDLPYEKGIINMKVRKSSRNYLYEAAMTEEEMNLCIERGAEVVRQCHAEGCNVLSLG